jgi:hypothetical protein
LNDYLFVRIFIFLKIIEQSERFSSPCKWRVEDTDTSVVAAGRRGLIRLFPTMRIVFKIIILAQTPKHFLRDAYMEMVINYKNQAEYVSTRKPFFNLKLAHWLIG